MKDELKFYIGDRVHSITNDSRTFLWARLQHDDSMNTESLKIGGGNLLIATGLFAALEYLSNIYAFLKLGANEVPRNKEACGGRINTTEAFAIFLTDCPYKIGLDSLGKNELRSLWSEWRNGLVHLLVQREGVANTIATDNNPELRGHYIETIQNINPDEVFSRESDGPWLCNVDILTHALDVMAEWVADVCEQEGAHLSDGLAWVKEEII